MWVWRGLGVGMGGVLLMVGLTWDFMHLDIEWHRGTLFYITFPFYYSDILYVYY